MYLGSGRQLCQILHLLSPRNTAGWMQRLHDAMHTEPVSTLRAVYVYEKLRRNQFALLGGPHGAPAPVASVVSPTAFPGGQDGDVRSCAGPRDRFFRSDSRGIKASKSFKEVEFQWIKQN